MDAVPFLLALVSLAGALAAAAWATGWRPAVGLIGATVVSVTAVSLDVATTALGLFVLAVLVAARFPWGEPVRIEIVIGEDELLRIRTR